MDLLKPIVRYVTDPLYLRRDGYVYRRHSRELDASQWLSAEALAGSRRNVSSELMDFCYRHNPFHRARMERPASIPSDIRKALLTWRGCRC
jgi:hypothetical protein